MTTNEGFATFNLLTYDKETQDQVYSSIDRVQSANKYLIEGEEDVNKVIILTKAGKSAKGNSTPEEERQANMEKVLKEWGVNKGIWLTEMRIKQKIDKIMPLKYVPLSGEVAGATGKAENGDQE
jgi:hypothetical protein